MEFFILLISVPLFLIIVFLFALFVLSNYPNREPTKASPPVENSTGANTDADNAVA